ncbi:GntR family transcriptional regulator [Lysobacter korlensis]|uniref:GntR family transcriptional regulator n=1 Tax=Lysobacter korlensis TaxID=553636 RepID=A0ABV6RUK2_9GAMM
MPENLGRPQRRALTEWALESLYDLVFTGELAPGDDLGEEELRTRLGVSRTTISAALRQLEADGLATVAAANGRRVVASFDVADVVELYTIRAVLEEFAAHHAAVRVTDEQLRRLGELQSEMEQRSATHRDPHRRDFEVDFDFHREIARASGMARIEACLSPLWNQTHAVLRHAYFRGVYADRTEDAAAYHDHREILAALTARDSDAAASAVRRHLEGRRDQLIAGIRRVTEG